MALGGGFELALACHGRVLSDDRKTVFGLPEVQLGLLPGLNGLERLAEKVGLQVALDHGLTGKNMRAEKARALGVADEVVPASILEDVAAELALRLAKAGAPFSRQAAKSKGRSFTETLTRAALEQNPVGRQLLFKKAREGVLEKTGGHYPAPEKILKVLEVWADKGFDAAKEVEARSFGELLMSNVSQRLIEIFVAQTALKKDSGVDDGVGVYTRRVLGPLMNEAAYILMEGVPVEVIDRAMTAWGWPVGPIALLDEVGRKNQRGFYLHGEAAKKRGRGKYVDESVYAVLGLPIPDPKAKASIPLEEIQMRCSLQFVNEALHCWGEGILRSPRDGDIGAIFGLGFPPFRGGPFRYVDELGARGGAEEDRELSAALRRVLGACPRAGGDGEERRSVLPLKEESGVGLLSRRWRLDAPSPGWSTLSMVGETFWRAASERIHRIVRGAWRLDALVAVDGTAATYLATGIDWAPALVRIVHASLAQKPVVAATLALEGWAARALGSPSSLSVRDEGRTDDGAAFLVFDRPEGAVLSSTAMWRPGGRLEVPAVLSITERLLVLLEALHGKGILVCHFGAANLFWGTDGQVRLFGLSGVRFSGPAAQLSPWGPAGVGAAEISPELLRPRDLDLGPTTDVWAVGAVMFTLLTGRPLRPGAPGDPAAELPKLKNLGTGVPRELAALVDGALAVDPEERWPSCKNMRALLGHTREARSAQESAARAPVSRATIHLSSASSEEVTAMGLPQFARDLPFSSPAIGASVAPSSIRPRSVLGASLTLVGAQPSLPVELPFAAVRVAAATELVETLVPVPANVGSPGARARQPMLVGSLGSTADLPFVKRDEPVVAGGPPSSAEEPRPRVRPRSLLGTQTVVGALAPASSALPFAQSGAFAAFSAEPTSPAPLQAEEHAARPEAQGRALLPSVYAALKRAEWTDPEAFVAALGAHGLDAATFRLAEVGLLEALGADARTGSTRLAQGLCEGAGRAAGLQRSAVPS